MSSEAQVDRAARSVARFSGVGLHWKMSVALAALAAAIRLPDLGWPRAFSFDETYYAKDAYSLLQFGYERTFQTNANEAILIGNLKVFGDGGEFVVHPPLGKWAIALGEAAFGMNPFGWRIVMALLGILAVVLVHRTTLRLTSNKHVAAIAGLFMAIDGEAIVLSRTALLDQTLMFFVLATFWALVHDRDAYARTLSMQRSVDRLPRFRSWRPWRILAIILITCAFSTKWSALWFAIAFAALALWWDARARKLHESDRQPWLEELGWLGLASVVGVAGYLLSWIGWFRSTDGWERNWTDGPSWLPQALRAFLNYHQQALHFHVTLTTDHPYKSSPFGWLLQLRPTSFFFQTYPAGVSPCPTGGEQCASEVLALGNVVVWWFASAILIMLVVNLLARLLRIRVAFGGLRFDGRQAGRLDWAQLSGPVVGVAAGWLPWLYYHERTTFTFYTIVITPFMCMIAAQGLALLATRRVSTASAPAVAVDFEVPADAPGAPHDEDATDPDEASAPSDDLVLTADIPPTVAAVDEVRTVGFVIAVVIVVCAVAFSLFAMPLWTGYPIAYSGWQMRMLLQSWV